MRLFAYRDATASRALGVSVDGINFHEMAVLAPDLPQETEELLGTDGALARLAELLAVAPSGRPIAEVTLLPFLERPNALWALALNFKTHIAETGLTTSLDYPHLFLRTAASYVGSGEPILAPPENVARAFDYEGELGVVIGKPGRHIPVERALDHVAGYTIVNEGSVREYQMHNRQFGLGKNFEASGSYGPWMVTADEFGDPTRHSIETRLNGIVRQRSGLDDLLVGVAETVAYLSQGYHLRPGDMIAMGTPGALPPAEDDAEGRDLSRQFGPFPTPGLVHMRPGDLAEVEISGIGTLSNPVIADQPATYRIG
ncbi:fumarylacetoacetate hydrolase family protein [Sphingomonas sp. OTU376]|uniref:fumarylacetoacetate hydrolase family protein n=1 Tax=Sphingomonas sp. OTU376 TaxID=3043863 RepID=UPI00313E1A1C